MVPRKNGEKLCERNREVTFPPTQPTSPTKVKNHGNLLAAALSKSSQPLSKGKLILRDSCRQKIGRTRRQQRKWSVSRDRDPNKTGCDFLLKGRCGSKNVDWLMTGCLKKKNHNPCITSG